MHPIRFTIIALVAGIFALPAQGNDCTPQNLTIQADTGGCAHQASWSTRELQAPKGCGRSFVYVYKGSTLYLDRYVGVAGGPRGSGSLSACLKDDGHGPQGLEDNVAYTVKVCTYHANGDGSGSDQCDSKPYTVGQPPGPPPETKVPAPPRNGQITAGDGRLSISWSPGAVGGQFGRSKSYGVHWHTDLSRAESWDPSINNIQSTSRTITGLTNGQQYHICLRACNEAGCGNRACRWTGTPVASTGNPTPTVPTGPPAPTNLQITNPSAGDIGVTWTDPVAWSGGSLVWVNYKISKIENGASACDSSNPDSEKCFGEAASPGAQKTTPYPLVGLELGSRYKVSIQAEYNPQGGGNRVYSSSVEDHIDLESCFAVVHTPTRSTVDSSKWSFGVEDGYDCILGYHITVNLTIATQSVSSWSLWPRGNHIGTNNPNIRYFSAESGQTWTVVLNIAHDQNFASNVREFHRESGTVGESGTPPPEPGNPPVEPPSCSEPYPPNRPVGLSVTPLNGGLRASWTAPSVSAAYGTAEDYGVCYTQGSDCTNYVWGGDTSRTMTGLVNGQSYLVKVISRNCKGANAVVSESGTPSAGGSSPGGGRGGGGGSGGGNDPEEGGGDDGDDGGDDSGSEPPPPPPPAKPLVCQKQRPSEWYGSIVNRCDEFDSGYCHRLSTRGPNRNQPGFVARYASSTVVMLESEKDFDLCVYDKDRRNEWPGTMDREEDCSGFGGNALDHDGLAARLDGKPENHGVQIGQLPDIGRMEYCVVPFDDDAVGRWKVNFHPPATLYATVVPDSRRCRQYERDDGKGCKSGQDYGILTVELENCRGTWIDKGGSCGYDDDGIRTFIVRTKEQPVDAADDGQEKCMFVNEDNSWHDADRNRDRPALELAYCFFDQEDATTWRLGTWPED